MVLEDLELEQIDRNLTVTIDNETRSLPVYKVNKLQTEIINQNNINTVLYAPIVLDLTLTYKNKKKEKKNINNDFVTATVTSLSQNTTYLQTEIKVNNGKIQAQLSNHLSIGEYLLILEYAGNIYYESTQLILQFSVGQRKAECSFHTSMPKGYPEDVINIGMTLLDALNGKKINNCVINYFFDNKEYVTYTNENGFANLIITIPSINTIECNQSLQYPLTVKIENKIYKLSNETYINVFVERYNTAISYITNIENTTVNIQGNVIGYKDDNTIVNVNYGNIDINVDEYSLKNAMPIYVDNNGNFSGSIEMNETHSNNVEPSQDPIIISQDKETVTDISILDTPPITRSYVKRHNINFKAKVTHQNEDVPYGMITFVITQNGSEIYRYITQIDDNGEGFFHFDMSTLGTYEVKAYYHGIFKYQNSESNKKTYTIEED